MGQLLSTQDNKSKQIQGYFYFASVQIGMAFFIGSKHPQITHQFLLFCIKLKLECPKNVPLSFQSAQKFHFLLRIIFLSQGICHPLLRIFALICIVLPLQYNGEI
jgi:hypothetical protein